MEAVDGLMLCLSPWAAGSLRFDVVTVTGFDAYDVDCCGQASRAGMRLIVDELGVVHHMKGGFGDDAAWARADAAFRAKWGLEPVLSPVRPSSLDAA